MPFAQTVDRRVGDLAEILAEELRDVARLVGDDRERRVVAHRPDRFLGVLDHRRQDQLHILHGQARGDLTAQQFAALEDGQARFAALGQIGHGAEAFDARAIVVRARDLVLDRAVFVEGAAFQIDRDHLAGAKAALLADARFGQQHHAAFGADDEQIVGGQRVAQRAQRVAVHARDRPAAIGHRERGGAVPRLHDAGEIIVHRLVRVGHFGLVRPMPRGRGSASRSARRARRGTGFRTPRRARRCPMRPPGSPA